MILFSYTTLASIDVSDNIHGIVLPSDTHPRILHLDAW